MFCFVLFCFFFCLLVFLLFFSWTQSCFLDKPTNHCSSFWSFFPPAPIRTGERKLRAGEGGRGRSCWKWMLSRREAVSGRWCVPCSDGSRLLGWGRGTKVGGRSGQGWVRLCSSTRQLWGIRALANMSGGPIQTDWSLCGVTQDLWSVLRWTEHLGMNTPWARWE